jgi:hypothetical protein
MDFYMYLAWKMALSMLASQMRYTVIFPKEGEGFKWTFHETVYGTGGVGEILICLFPGFQKTSKESIPAGRLTVIRKAQVLIQQDVRG